MLKTTASLEEVEAAMRAAGLPVRFCGLNADWAFAAWHLGPSPYANLNKGDRYLLDTEDWGYALVRTDDTEFGFTPILDGAELWMAINEAVNVMKGVLT